MTNIGHLPCINLVKLSRCNLKMKIIVLFSFCILMALALVNSRAVIKRKSTTTSIKEVHIKANATSKVGHGFTYKSNENKNITTKGSLLVQDKNNVALPPNLRNTVENEDDQNEDIIKGENVKEFDKSNVDSEKLFETKLEDLLQKHHNKNSERDLKLNDLGLSDHMDGVKLENDGHINKDYKKEVLFGDVDDLGSSSDNLIISTFKKADNNHDAFLTADELEVWIQKRVEDHLLEAKAVGMHVFKKLDKNKDGYLKWSEYLEIYNDMKLSENHENHLDEKDETQNLELDEDDIARYKRRWDSADTQPKDGRLSPAEFIAFKHPEQSSATLDGMVSDLLVQLDRDNDKIITLKEFLNLPDQGVDIEWVDMRKKEFTETLDGNKDGKVTMEELKLYVDPRHPKHAKDEALSLVDLADEDRDGKLSLEEVMSNKDVFMGSKMMNVVYSFHDEF